MANLSLERNFGGVVVGCDEAGRGPLVGPVVAAACIIPADVVFSVSIDDSKKLSAKKRALAEAEILGKTVFGLGEASVEEILELNILGATMLAMRRSVEAILEKGVRPDLVLIDGNRLPDLGGLEARCVVGGDAISLSIAAASIIAKEHRDRLMRDLARQFPQYGWERNAGYGTADHLKALATYGATPYHRAGFGPVRDAISRSQGARKTS